MGTYGIGDGYTSQSVARRSELVQKWTKKYKALGLNQTQIERILQKRLSRSRV